MRGAQRFAVMSPHRPRSLRLVPDASERPTRPAPRLRSSPVRAEAAASVSDDLSAAAKELLGTLSVLQRALASDPPQLSTGRLRAHVDAAIGTATYADHLTRELGVYAGGEPRLPEPVSVREAVATALLLVGPHLDPRGRVDFIDAPDAWIRARTATLVRVLVNVLTELDASSRGTATPHDIEIETTRRGDELEVTITDRAARWPSDAVAQALSLRDLAVRGALTRLARARASIGAIGGHLGVELAPTGGVTVVLLVPVSSVVDAPRTA